MEETKVEGTSEMEGTKMDETVRIYPSLSYEMDIAKHKDRVRYMKDKESQLLLRLEHYNKLRKRWSNALTIVISSGVLTIPVVATALTRYKMKTHFHL